jgi:hypothetical protein
MQFYYKTFDTEENFKVTYDLVSILVSLNITRCLGYSVSGGKYSICAEPQEEDW